MEPFNTGSESNVTTRPELRTGSARNKTICPSGNREVRLYHRCQRPVHLLFIWMTFLVIVLGFGFINEPVTAMQNQSRPVESRVPIMIVDPIGAFSGEEEQPIIERSRYYDPVDFGSVPQDQLTRVPDHDFPYEILAKTRVISFEEKNGSIIARIEDVFRIKIYTSEPREQIEASLVTIPVLRGQESEQVDQIRGITHQPGGEWVELSQADIRRTQYSNQIDLIEFLMPDVRAGSVLEYRYRITRNGIEELPDFFFSDRVPVEFASLHMVHQSYLRYEEQLQDPKKQVSFQPERMDTSSVRRLFSERRPEPVYIAHWIADQVPAEEMTFEAEPASGSRTGIRFLIGEFGLPRQTLENSWEVVAARLRRAYDPFLIAESALNFQAVGDSIARHVNEKKAQKGDSIDSMGSIENQISLEREVLHQSTRWIQENTLFNQSTSIFPDSIALQDLTPQEAMGQGSRHLALMAVLKGAGLEALPVYYSDGVFGVMDTLFPSIHQLQRMALLVTLSNGETIMTDATYEAATPGFILSEALGQSAFVLQRGQGYAFTELKGDQNRYSSHFEIKADLTSNGDLFGEMAIILEGYPALQAHREHLQAAGKGAPKGFTPDVNPSNDQNTLAGADSETNLFLQQWIRSLFLDRYQEVRITETEIQDAFMASGRVEIQATFEIPDFAVEFQDALDFSPMIMGYLDENPFEAEQRRTAVELDAPEELSVQIELRTPQGFLTEAFMENERIELPGARYTQQLTYSASGLSYGFYLNRQETRFAVSDYPQLREMYRLWVDWSRSRWRLMRKV